MKTTFTRLFTYCLIGTSVLLTSCVAEDLSPEVEQLRRSQADFMDAKTALEMAKVETQQAETALLQLQAQMEQALMEAKVAKAEAEAAIAQAQADLEAALLEGRVASEIAALEAAMAQLQLDNDLLETQLATEQAKLQTEIAQAELAAAQARLATQQAVDALAGQINETAQGYLDLYETTMMRASNKMDQINNLKTIVARYEANLDASGNVLDFTQVEAQLEAQIAADMAEIEAIQENIARLQGLNSNADDVREELTSVENRIDELNSALNEVNLAMDRAYNAYEPYEEIFSSLQNTVTNIETTENTIFYYEENYLPLLNSEIEQTMERLEPYQVDLAEVEDQLTAEIETLQSHLETAEDAWYAWEYASLNGTPDEEQDAQDEYDAAVQVIIDYTGAFYGPASNAGAYTNWYVYYPNSGTTFGDAVLAVSEIQDYPTYQNLVSQLNNLNSQLLTATNNLNSNIWNLEYWQNLQQELLASVDAETVDAYYAARSAAIMDYNAEWEARNDIQAQLDTQWDLRWDLYYYLNDPNRAVAYFENQISDYQNQVVSLMADIQDNQELLAQNAFEASEMEAMIARTEAKIDRLMEEYEVLVDLAEEYLDMFYTTIENN